MGFLGKINQTLSLDVNKETHYLTVEGDCELLEQRREKNLALFGCWIKQPIQPLDYMKINLWKSFLFELGESILTHQCSFPLVLNLPLHYVFSHNAILSHISPFNIPTFHIVISYPSFNVQFTPFFIKVTLTAPPQIVPSSSEFSFPYFLSPWSVFILCDFCFLTCFIMCKYLVPGMECGIPRMLRKYLL